MSPPLDVVGSSTRDAQLCFDCRRSRRAGPEGAAYDLGALGRLRLAGDSDRTGEGVESLPGHAKAGLNDWKRSGYGGPCPPIGRHRYFHKLYALDKEIGELESPTKQDVVDAMQGHILDEAVLIGTYAKRKA